MPAHFTSGNGRLQTFLINYGELNATDEYEMASQAWYNQPEGLSEPDAMICLRIGEDIMVGSYILAKEGIVDNNGRFREGIVEANLEMLSQTDREQTLVTLIKRAAVEYFDFCADFGTNSAIGVQQ